MKLASASICALLLLAACGSANAGCKATYTVQSGDALSVIADDYSTTVSEIQSVNPDITNPDDIQVGQQIKIPPCTSEPAPSGDCKAIYTVQSGDALSTIADNYGTTVSDIQAVNPDITDPDSIQVGQQIKIPPCGGSSPSPVPDPVPEPVPSPAPSGEVTLSAEEFTSGLNAAGYDSQPDSKRTNMLASISRLGGANVISSRRELAMFLGQLMRESIGLSTIKEIDGEYASYAPYYGRGYIQLTNEDNYATASQALYGDNRLVDNPDQILENDNVAWDVTTFYWKTRVHEAFPDGIAAGQFGVTTKGINGGECSANPDRAQTRCDAYGHWLTALGINETPDCSGCL